MTDSDDEKEILAWATEYAKTHGYRLNSEEKRLDGVIRGLARNKQRFGARYCPCRIRSGDMEKDKRHYMSLHLPRAGDKRTGLLPLQFIFQRRNIRVKKLPRR